MTQTPRDVIKETISQASTFFVAQTEGGYGVINAPSDLKKLIEDLDAAEDREQKLKEAVQNAISKKPLWIDEKGVFNTTIGFLTETISTLYPDTPAQPAPTTEVTARPIDDWHEDHGDVLWWGFPVCEPPYCGSPLCSDWPGYHTHWTPLMIPAAPAPKEGDNQ